MKERKLNIAIIDDEQHAVETLAYDLRELFYQVTEIVFTATNPFEGARQVRLYKPDILFLDIRMPGLSGFEIVKIISDLETKVVLTTAHPGMLKQRQPDGIIACLLKPVLSTDLQNIISKIKSGA